jgi:YggT family protein
VNDNIFTRFVYDVTEPIMGIFRRLIPPRPSFPIDLSPILAFIVLQLIESIIIRIILQF